MTVLLVDSDKQALDREARRLAGRQSGMMVVLHSSADDAIKFAMRHDVDILFTRSVLTEMTGLELIRRIVGMANVKDITTIADETARARAEKICITAAIDFIMNRDEKKCGKCFLNTLQDAIRTVDGK